MKGQTGASSNIEVSPQRRKRKSRRMQRETARWNRKNGPVTVRFVDPATLRKKP